jgi:glycosyltransferase involved in cell wall biosynthesis
MRIAIDLSAVREDMTGPVVYCLGFLTSLAKIDQDNEYLVFLASEIEQLIRKDLPRNFKIHITKLSNRVWLRVLWGQCVLPIYLKKWCADVLFAAFDVSPLMAQCPVVLGVRNPLPIRINNSINLKGRFHRILSYYSCKKAHSVFYPTLYASKVLGEALKVPPTKRNVVPHGTDHKLWETFQDTNVILESYGIAPFRYFLFISNFYPYKNPDILIKAYHLWHQKNHHLKYKLVIVGEAPKIYKRFKQQLINLVDELKLSDLVIFTGYVPRLHLPVLYHNSASFILPTTIETFGQPFVEAMSSGAPVICADTDFSRELCGNTAMYVTPNNIQSLSDAITFVVNNPSKADIMRQTGKERSQMFSWEREARETLDLLLDAGSQSIHSINAFMTW